MPALLVAGTGKVSTKAAVALIKDHTALYSDEDELALGLVLGANQKAVAWGLLDHLDDLSPDAVALFGVTGAVVDDDILENVDEATFDDNPNMRAIALLEEGDVLLLAYDEDDEASSIEAVKLAQAKGAKVLDLTDGLLELLWEDDDEADEDDVTPEDEGPLVEEIEEIEPTPEGEETLTEVLEAKPKRTRATREKKSIIQAVDDGDEGPEAKASLDAARVELYVEDKHFKSGWDAGYAQAREDLMAFLGGAFYQ